jgi:hypothetical protein
MIRGFVTVAFTLTVCGLLIYIVVWGSIQGDWEPLSRSGITLGAILGYLLKSFFS